MNHKLTTQLQQKPILNAGHVIVYDVIIRLTPPTSFHHWPGQTKRTMQDTGRLRSNSSRSEINKSCKMTSQNMTHGNTHMSAKVSPPSQAQEEEDEDQQNFESFSDSDYDSTCFLVNGPEDFDLGKLIESLNIWCHDTNTHSIWGSLIIVWEVQEVTTSYSVNGCAAEMQNH